jgi:hypothetical protein
MCARPECLCDGLIRRPADPHRGPPCPPACRPRAIRIGFRPKSKDVQSGPPSAKLLRGSDHFPRFVVGNLHPNGPATAMQSATSNAARHRSIEPPGRPRRSGVESKCPHFQVGPTRNGRRPSKAYPPPSARHSVRAVLCALSEPRRRSLRRHCPGLHSSTGRWHEHPGRAVQRSVGRCPQWSRQARRPTRSLPFHFG